MGRVSLTVVTILVAWRARRCLWRRRKLSARRRRTVVGHCEDEGRRKKSAVLCARITCDLLRGWKSGSNSDETCRTCDEIVEESKTAQRMKSVLCDLARDYSDTVCSSNDKKRAGRLENSTDARLRYEE